MSVPGNGDPINPWLSDNNREAFTVDLLGAAPVQYLSQAHGTLNLPCSQDMVVFSASRSGSCGATSESLTLRNKPRLLGWVNENTSAHDAVLRLLPFEVKPFRWACTAVGRFLTFNAQLPTKLLSSHNLGINEQLR